MDTELWGTFSVNDHRRRRAFVADVLVYDRVAVPVPDGSDEWDRWARRGRDPQRQKALLTILATHAVRIPWTLKRHGEWAERYGKELDLEKKGAALGGARARVAKAVEFDARNVNEARDWLAAQGRPEELDSLAQSATRLVLASHRGFEEDIRLLEGLPRAEVEAVPAFGSMRHFEDNQPYRLDATGRDSTAAGNRPVLMFEWSFLVPSNSSASPPSRTPLPRPFGSSPQLSAAWMPGCLRAISPTRFGLISGSPAGRSGPHPMRTPGPR